MIQRPGAGIGYVFAAAVSWAAFPVEAGLAYVLLLAGSLLTRRPVGGPLSGPFLVILAALAGVPLVTVLVVPTAGIAGLLARRGRWRWSIPSALAVVGGGGGALAAAWTFAVGGSWSEGLIGWAILRLGSDPVVGCLHCVGRDRRRNVVLPPQIGGSQWSPR